MTHVWYRALSTQIVTGASSPIKVTQRVIVDQFGFAPLFTTSFVGLLWLLEGRSSIEIQSQLKTAIPEIIVAGWSLWIPAMTLNFSVVPIKYQVLYSNVVALVWNVYLSYKSSIAHIKQKDNGGTDDRTDTTDNKREQSR
jgi:Mpv17 / PMP22 family